MADPAGTGDFPVVAPEEAVTFFRKKGFRFGFSWLDVFQSEHARAFTVAKAMTRDLLEDIRAAVDAAIADGTTLETFTKMLRPTLEAKGWWGKKIVLDPVTGQHELAQLGSPRRLKTIFNVNMRVAYETGKWERIRRTQSTFPFLRYTAVLDGRERPEHHARHGTILRANDSWWDKHTPPCGWECRCTVLSYNQRQLDRRGLDVTENPVVFPTRPWTNKRTGKVTNIEQGIDPGWSYHVGKAPLEGISPEPIPPQRDDKAVSAVRPVPKAVADLRTAFGLSADGVFTDAAGWPLAISARWLKDLSFARQDAAIKAVRTIVLPKEIRLVWVTGANGRALLMRRYVGGDWTVDIGGEGWRWRERRAVEDAGIVIWAA
jgi:SPP1 gp7 family putative phage head morphogenesis protein